MRYMIDLDLHQIYSLVSDALLILFFVSLILFVFIKKNIHLKFLNRFYHFLHNNPKKIKMFVLILSMMLILGFFTIKYQIYVIDKLTTVYVDDKIVIIEIDDYWNINDTSEYFERYGYTMKDYKEVSDILDKHGAVASLGVTPYIFIEEIRENFALKDDEGMISYLKELNERGYELGMHGYNHCRNVNYCPKYEEVWYNIFNGKLELEEIFGKSFMTYLPPGNYWTTEQYENVKKAGFKVIGNTHVPKVYFDEEVIITNRAYDPIYYYGWYAFDFRHTFVDEWIGAYNNQNLFIIQLHVNTFDSQEKLDDLDTFLAYIKNDGAKIMTYGDFYDYINEKQNLEKGVTGRIIAE